eukprot:symbB.v1.2.010505.t1/scaffold690.1/size332707/3
MQEFQMQNISNLAWSFATLHIGHNLLFQSLASAVLLKLSQFSGQALANSIWAFGTLGAPRCVHFESHMAPCLHPGIESGPLFHAIPGALSQTDAGAQAMANSV